MTHLGLGSFLEEPWECLVGVGGIIAFLGGGADLLGGLGGPMPGGVPTALPKSVVWIASFTCLGTGRVGRSAAF